MVPPRVEVVHVGSACRDVVPEDPRGWRLGGGVTYASLTTARLGLRTAAIVGVDATAADARASSTCCATPASTSCACRSPRARSSTTSRRPTGRVQTCVRTGVPLPVPDDPRRRGWPRPAGPGAGRRRGRATTGRAHPARGALAVAWQGLLRELRGGRAGTRRPPRPSRDPAPRRSRRREPPRRRARRRRWPSSTALLHPGADLLVTQGGRGRPAGPRSGRDGPTETLRYLPTATTREVDPTGAGDTFLAALQASVLRPARRRLAGRSRRRARTCGSRPPPGRSSSRAGASTACRTGRPSSSGGRASGVRRAVAARPRSAGRCGRPAVTARRGLGGSARISRGGRGSGRAADLEADREHDDRRRDRDADLGSRRRSARRAPRPRAARSGARPPSGPSRRCSGARVVSGGST